MEGKNSLAVTFSLGPAVGGRGHGVRVDGVLDVSAGRGHDDGTEVELKLRKCEPPAALFEAAS